MTRTIIKFVLTALLVAIIGGFAGWYFFIQNKVEDTQNADAARGSEDTSFIGEVGSTFQNIVAETITTTGKREVGKRAPRLWQITKSPVAGFGFAYSTGAVFIAERATGNILRADPDTSAIVRLTNTLVPKVREAVFSRSGDVVLRTTADDESIQSFAATIATSTELTATSTPNVLNGVYLQRDIVALDAQSNAPTARGLFSITKNPDGGTVAATSDWKGTGLKKVFTSPLTQWRVQWLADGRAVIVQNASDNMVGYAFIVNSSGVMRSLAQNLPGLTLVHHESSDAYLYGSSENGQLDLYVKVAAGEVVKLPIQTTADKCVWAPGAGLIAYCGVPAEIPDGRFLDRWYQGALHTSDSIWKIEASTGHAERFFATDSRITIDIENPSMDDTGAYLGFRNATDKSLWLLRIAE